MYKALFFGLLIVGGFVFGELGRLPVIDDEVYWGKARFRVIGMDGRRIARLAIRIAPDEPEEGDL